MAGAGGVGGSGGAQGAQGHQGAQGGGGGGSGSPVVRKFAFAFNTANILTGASLYTPTIGDVLLDAWVLIDTAWNGTTPRGDVGLFLPDADGFFHVLDPTMVILMDDPGDTVSNGLFQSAGATTISAAMTVVNMAQYMLEVNGAGPGFKLASDPAGIGPSIWPGRFATTDPIKVVVSQDGTPTGADPGSTQGSATLYLITATPV